MKKIKMYYYFLEVEITYFGILNLAQTEIRKEIWKNIFKQNKFQKKNIFLKKNVKDLCYFLTFPSIKDNFAKEIIMEMVL